VLRYSKDFGLIAPTETICLDCLKLPANPWNHFSKRGVGGKCYSFPVDWWAQLQMNIKQVAKKARVSTATVSRIINDSSLVSPETARRVWRIIRKVSGQLSSG